MKYRNLRGVVCMSNHLNHSNFMSNWKLLQQYKRDHKEETLYDRDEFKLIERVCDLRKQNPNIKVGEIKRPLILDGVADGVYEVDVQW